MEPEKKSLEKEIPFKETIIFRFHVIFRGSAPLKIPHSNDFPSTVIE